MSTRGSRRSASFWTHFLPRTVRNRIEGRPNLKKAITNTGWLLADRFVRLGLGFAIGVWIARYLGPEQFGTLNYAIAFVSLFGAISTLGMDKIIVRDIVHERDSRQHLLGTAFVLRLGGSLLAIALAIAAVVLLRPNERISQLLVGVIALASLFQTADVIEFWFESQVLAKYTVIARNAAFLIVAAIRIALILTEAPVLLFAYAILAEAAIGAGGLLVAYRRLFGSVLRWQPRAVLARRLLTDSWPLVFSGLAVTAYMRIDLIMLGEMMGDEAAGVYSAATRLSEVWYFLPMIALSTLFPYIVASRRVDHVLYMSRLQRVYTLMTWLSITVAVPVAFLSKEIVLLLYGPAYGEAGRVLSIHAWGSIAVFMGVATSQYLLAENLQKISLYRTLIGLVCNVFLNLALIPVYGITGAALATVVSYFVATFSIVIFKRGGDQALMLFRSLNPFNLGRRGV